MSCRIANWDGHCPSLLYEAARDGMRGSQEAVGDGKVGEALCLFLTRQDWTQWKTGGCFCRTDRGFHLFVEGEGGVDRGDGRQEGGMWGRRQATWCTRYVLRSAYSARQRPAGFLASGSRARRFPPMKSITAPADPDPENRPNPTSPVEERQTGLTRTAPGGKRQETPRKPHTNCSAWNGTKSPYPFIRSMAPDLRKVTSLCHILRQYSFFPFFYRLQAALIIPLSSPLRILRYRAAPRDQSVDVNG